MARPPRIDVPGTLYHVIARGNQRRHIFRDEADYQRYTELLAATNSDTDSPFMPTS